MTANPLSPALDLLYGDDPDAFRAALDADPSVLTRTVDSTDGHYCGYFHQATLLHHVAANPEVRPIPEWVDGVLAEMVERGADVNALTAQGPAQPDDIGWTTFGLLATTGKITGPRRRAMLETLVACGADVDLPNGGPLVGALYYRVHDGAADVVDLGADVDLPAAAGLGRIDLMEPWFAGDGTELRPGAQHLIHYATEPMPDEPTDAQVLAMALAWAARAGEAGAVRWLLDRGVDPAVVGPVEHGGTALHFAAYTGDRECVDALLGAGAPLDVRCVSFDGRPLDWAMQAGNTELAPLLTP